MSRFQLGRLVSTRGALERVPNEEMLCALRRHASGDWGNVCPDDAASNADALGCGARLLSSYKSTGGVRFWIITEGDRSATTVLLPEEY